MRYIGPARLALLAAAMGLCAFLGRPSPVLGASFTLDATYDAVDASPGDGVCADAGGACTLRAAVMETNALPGADEISLPAGTYVLSIPGSGEDASATGDLDVSDVAITGDSANATKIDASGLNDRVFHIPFDATIRISGLTIQNGGTLACCFFGGGIFNAGDMTASDLAIVANEATSGGAVWNEGALDIETSVISDNRATSFGVESLTPRG